MQYLVLIPRSEKSLSMTLQKKQVEAEAEFVRRLYVDGRVRQIWLRAEGGACMIAESDDEAGLKQILSDLPLVKAGYLAQPLVSQLRPYSGFGPRGV
ncbi:hypothetical protein [Pinirhizobacter sp.]|jgi:muconolactone delta-isomerase|uniref:hypothetical protein n=1 Tax=Pinirhizobacter sp. TaxID=2950432 RepID=UPI002F3EF2F1